MTFDQDKARAFALKVWKYKEGEVVSLMIHLGDRLGLYAALRGGVPATPDDLAGRTGLDARWVTEWLLGQAAAGVLDRDVDGAYSMSAETEQVMVDDESLLFAAGAFSGGTAPDIVDQIADSFRTGRGFTYGGMDRATARQIDRMSGAWLRTFLIDSVFPLLEGVQAKLERGANVVDIGCGGGIALEAIASAYPLGRYQGLDTSRHAITLAEDRVASMDNVTVSLIAGEDLDASHPYDLAMTLECLHDAPRPDLIARAVRLALKPDGTWLIKDIRCGPSYESNAANPVLAMMYGFSIISCLASGTSVTGGAALGTLGLPPTAVESLVKDAGFSDFRVHDLEDPVHLYYEVRP